MTKFKAQAQRFLVLLLLCSLLCTLLWAVPKPVLLAAEENPDLGLEAGEPPTEGEMSLPQLDTEANLPAGGTETLVSKLALEDIDLPRPEDAWPTLDQISCAAYIVADGDTGEILFGENTDAIAYPASMTKIMTALVILEHPEYDPARPILFTEIACAMPAPESTTAGFLPGEECPTISCLYVMMMRSANEAANALAENYGGSIEGFVELMNAKAIELGCENTNFLDPCGFGYVDHHTTAEDMVKIIRRAMQHPIFQSLVSTKLYSLPPTNLHPVSGWSNTINGNYLLTFSEGGWASPWLASIDGVKPGHTDLAGDCLATAATTYDGRHLIAVIFDANYVGEYPNSYVGSSIMSHTLLEEGAKAMGAPRKDLGEQFQASDHTWPVQAKDLEPERDIESPEPLPSFTVVAPSIVQDQAQVVEDDQIVIGRLPLLLIFMGFSFFLVLTLIFAYQLYRKRKQERILRRFEERHF